MTHALQAFMTLVGFVGSVGGVAAFAWLALGCWRPYSQPTGDSTRRRHAA